MKTRPEGAKWINDSWEGEVLEQTWWANEEGWMGHDEQWEEGDGRWRVMSSGKKGMVGEGISLWRGDCISLPSFPSQEINTPLLKYDQLPTCSHAAKDHQPPLWDLGKHHCHTVPTLQATGPWEDIGCLLADFTQFSEVPFHFLPPAAHPPQGWTWRSLANLRKEKACRLGDMGT
jgi:hypothetical protein